MTRGSDGSVARYLDGFYDRQRNEPCKVRFEDDGTVQCAPVAERPVLAYADAACTQPVWSLYDPTAGCLNAPDEARAVRLDPIAKTGCEAETYYELPSAGPIVPAALFENVEGSCTSRPVRPNERYYLAPAVPTAIPRTALVQFARSAVLQGEGRVKVERIRLHGEDGSDSLLPYPYHLVDTVRDESCAPETYGAAGTRCVPDSAGFAQEAYVSPTCDPDTVVYGVDEPSACASPLERERSARYLRLPSTDTCTNGPLHARPATAPVSAPVHAFGLTATCSELPHADYWPLSDLGAPIDGTTLAAVAGEWGLAPPSFYATQGTQLEVQVNVLLASDSSPLELAQLPQMVDAATQGTCGNFVPTKEGAFCFPGGVTRQQEGAFFLDASCTEPARSVELLDDHCGPETPAPRFLYEGEQTLCAQLDVYDAPAPVPGDGYTRGVGGQCVAWRSAFGDRAGWRHYLYRASDVRPTDLSKLVKVTVTREY